MNNKSSILTVSIVAALAFGMAPLQAQRQGNPNLGQERRELRGQQQQGEKQEESGRVGKFHKASKLVGMDVKNMQDEELGEIQDLVVDLQSGRISYVVLSSGGILGVGEKYIAIPPSAFSYAPQGDQLVLNADKSKIQQAPGFTRDNWPDVENPAWGAYWGARATGQQQQDLQQQQQLQRQPGLQQQQQLPGAQGRPGERDEIEQRRELRQPGQAGAQAGQEAFTGQIVSMDPQSRTMTVKGDLGTQVFVIDQAATVRLKDVPSGKLSDLNVGDKVRINFKKQQDGSGIAYTIESDEGQRKQQ